MSFNVGGSSGSSTGQTQIDPAFKDAWLQFNDRGDDTFRTMEQGYKTGSSFLDPSKMVAGLSDMEKAGINAAGNVGAAGSQATGWGVDYAKNVAGSSITAPQVNSTGAWGLSTAAPKVDLNALGVGSAAPKVDLAGVGLGGQAPQIDLNALKAKAPEGLPGVPNKDAYANLYDIYNKPDAISQVDTSKLNLGKAPDLAGMQNKDFYSNFFDQVADPLAASQIDLNKLGSGGAAPQIDLQRIIAKDPTDLPGMQNKDFYTDYVNRETLDPMFAAIERQRKMGINQNSSDATLSGGEGAWRGSRAGIADAGTNEAATRAAGELAASTSMDRFRTASDLQQADIGRNTLNRQQNADRVASAEGQNASLRQGGQQFDAGQRFDALRSNADLGASTALAKAGQVFDTTGRDLDRTTDQGQFVSEMMSRVLGENASRGMDSGKNRVDTVFGQINTDTDRGLGATQDNLNRYLSGATTNAGLAQDRSLNDIGIRAAAATGNAQTQAQRDLELAGLRGNILTSDADRAGSRDIEEARLLSDAATNNADRQMLGVTTTQDNRLRAADVLGNLGGQQQQMALTGSQAQMDAGGYARDYEQSRIDAATEEFLRRQGLPLEALKAASVPYGFYPSTGQGGTTTSKTKGSTVGGGLK